MEEGRPGTSPQGQHGEGDFGHVPVLLNEAMEFLRVGRGGIYIDATVGAGGHSFEIAKRLGAEGRLIGFDKDPTALAVAGSRLRAPAGLERSWPAIELRHGSFAGVGTLGPESAAGLLADLGLSSLQLRDASRGFSFQAEGELDMRMDPRSERTADQVVNRAREEDLADAIYKFGEERRSRRIARAIVRARPIRSTAHLAQVISAAARPMKQPGKTIHPATLTFQAIRIWVNHELEDLEALLEAAPRILQKGGRLVIISFHSLEDRLVKDAMRLGAQQGIYRPLTKKPVTAGDAERRRNPRARSAKLRAAERI
ncbi:MAG: 16S rRNA (cytosine(1402)-N(4))-methyltransferase RsmH [Acidobacteria bacterium]|nr:16S rRNA (cytosine(1402)-N(4))-methyltransferase RsmH [Acidobacteriota bacterium]